MKENCQNSKGTNASQELIYHMALQMKYLVQEVLWLRMVFADSKPMTWEGKIMSSESIDCLYGYIYENMVYMDFMENYLHGKDPLDLSEFKAMLKDVYRQAQLAKKSGK